MQLGLDVSTWPIKYIVAYSIFVISALTYAIFWVWALIHAASTPKAKNEQRMFWSASMFLNPSTAVWYWYIWKRRVFWVLFTPIFGLFLSLPLVVKSLLSKADETWITNLLFVLGSPTFVILVAVLMVFPTVMRLAALLHLGKNDEMSALDRNDWIVALSMPVFGFGAGLAYCARYRRKWAIASLFWWALIALSFKTIAVNLNRALQPTGEEKRIEFRESKH